ncbi:MAG: hypothetical protein KF861_04455 [Planctomycetaceae bacterium]|nr:hypothetical protein [Planctomycetaceae bacterium]
MSTAPHAVGRPSSPPENAASPEDSLGPQIPIEPRPDAPSASETPARTPDNVRQGPGLGPLEAPPPGSSSRSIAPPESPPTVVRGQPLELIVEAPETASVGEEIPFAITVRNSQDIAVDDVTVMCTLLEGIVYPGADERVFRQRLGRLGPREERRLDLTLRGEQAGELCVEFSLSADGIEEVVQQKCVTGRDDSVSLNVSGPDERSVGSRAEFVVTVINLTGRDQPDVHVFVKHEGVLEAREASAGAVSQPDGLEWDLGLLRIDERVQIQVEFACPSPTEQTWLAVRVIGRDLPPRETRSGLQVVPLREIEIDVTDDQDPVFIGEKVQYVVRITNHGLTTTSRLVLQIDADGLQPSGVSIDEVDRLSSAEYDPVNNVLRLPLIEALGTGELQTVALQATATHSGPRGLRVRLMRPDGTVVATALETTVINILPGSIASGASEPVD